MTLLEVAFGMSLFALTIGAVITTMQQGNSAFQRSTTNATLDMRVGRAMENLIQELAPADSDTLLPAAPDGDAWVEFSPVVDYVGGAPVLGTPVRVAAELATNELDNGLDDNGDGLVDERILVRTIDPGTVDEVRLVMARGVRRFMEGEEDNGLDDNGNGLVDEPGLNFELDGNTLNLRLTCEMVGPNRDVVVRTLETSVTLRN